MLTSVVMVQYTVLLYFLKGAALTQTGKKPILFLVQPLAYGVACGTGFGLYENLCYPQVKSRPEEPDPKKKK